MNNTTRSQVLIGVLLIIVGVLLFFNTIGYIDRGLWQLLFKMWPLFLILIGLNLILNDTSIWWLVPVLAVIIVLSIVIAAQEGYLDIPDDFEFSYYKSSNQEFHKDTRLLRKIKLDVNLGLGRFYLDSLHKDDMLYSLHSRSLTGRPGVVYINKGSTGHVKLGGTRGLKRLSGIVGDWGLKINPGLPLDVEINAIMGKLVLDFRGLNLNELQLDTWSGVHFIYPGNNNCNLNIRSGVGTVILYIPENTAIKIKTEGLLNKHNFLRAGLINVGEGIFQSPNFEKAPVKINVVLSSTIGKFNVKYY